MQYGLYRPRRWPPSFVPVLVLRKYLFSTVQYPDRFVPHPSRLPCFPLTFDLAKSLSWSAFFTTNHHYYHQLFKRLVAFSMSHSHSDTPPQETLPRVPQPCPPATDLAAHADGAAAPAPASPGNLEKAVSADSSSASEPEAPALEKWNQPTVNRNRYFATVFGLTVMGLNDACLGALIPYVRSRRPLPPPFLPPRGCLPASLYLRVAVAT